MATTDDHIDRLPAPPPIRPTSQAERVADMLRTFVINGELAPGVRLSEEKLSRKYQISRNTLREAFRLLSRDRLLVHHMHRGVFVASPTEEDVRDLFKTRRALELPAVRDSAQAPEALVAAVGAAVSEGEAARAEQDWWAMGSANMRFHEALVALAQSARINGFMRQVMAETRLVFHAMTAPREFHGPYLPWNRRIHLALVSGDTGSATEELTEYLATSEQQLHNALAQMERSEPG